MAKRTSGELKRLAREYLIGNYITPILAMLIASFLPAMVLAPFSMDLPAEINFTTVTYGIAALIIQILGQLLTIGVTRIHLLLANKQQATLMDLFWAFRNRPDRFILAALLFFGIMLIPAVPSGICVALLVKTKSISAYLLLGITLIVLSIIGLIFTYMYNLIYPLYIENQEMAVLEGFRTSRILMRGNKMRLFVLQLSFIGWQLLALCSMGIGLLWINPYITQTSANFYLDVTGQFDKKAEHIDVTITDRASYMHM